MQKRDYVLLAVVATMLASPSLFIILPNVNETIIATIVTIVEGGMLLILKQYFFGNEIPYSKKEEHTKKICEVFMLLTRVKMAQGRHNISLWEHFLRFPTKYKSEFQIAEELLEGALVDQLHEDQLNDHPAYLYYDRALEHLKRRKYKHIYKHWENAKNLLDELNGKTSIKERLEGVIKEKMHHYFPALQSSRSVIESSDHYNPYNIMQFMMKSFKYQDNFSKTAASELVCGESAGVKFVCRKLDSNYRYITVKSDSEIDFETYKKLVREIQEDGSLNDFYHESVKEYSNIIKELNDFKDKLEKLVKDLKTGKLIEGKCDAGF